MSAIRFACIGAVVLFAAAVSAFGQASFPAFTGQRVTVEGAQTGDFAALESVLASAGAAGDRSWYLVVVSRTGLGADAHHAYEDSLWERWLRESTARGRELDPDRTILVLLSTGDRQISLRPGVALQRDYGFRAQRIDEEIVRPYFIPKARAGDPVGGIREVVAQTEAWFKRADEARAAQARAAEEGRRRDAAEAAGKVAELRSALDRTAALERRRVAEGFATGDAGRTLEILAGKLTGAERTLAGHPEGAHAAAVESLRSAEELEIRLTHLGKHRDQARETITRAGQEIRDLRASLERARLEGWETGDLAATAERLDAELQAARGHSGFDYIAARIGAERVLGGVHDARARLLAAEREAVAAVERRFLTHTVAPGVGVALLLLAAAGWGFARRRKHVTRRAEVVARLSAHNERIVAVMQTLDGLKERCRTYLVTEGGDESRIAGRTLEEYHRIRRELDSAWTVWVGQNEQNSQARGMIEEESPLGTEKLEAADRILREAAEIDQTKVQSAIVAMGTALEALEQSRAAVRERIADVDRSRGVAEGDIARIAAAGYPATPYADDLEAIETARATATGREEKDPLGAIGAADECVKLAHALTDLTHHIGADLVALDVLRKAIEESAASAATARKEGFLLREENGNPDPLLDLARAEVEETRQCIAVADHAGAVEQLRQGTDFAARAAHVVASQRAARDFVKRDLPLRVAETARLAAAWPGAEIAHQTLARDHRSDAWARVGRCAADARAWMEGFPARIQEAETQSSAKAQKYFHAANLLEGVKADQERADKAMNALHARLAELLAFREDVGRLQTALGERSRELHAFLAERAGRVQPGARARAQHAFDGLASALALAEKTPPNWEESRHALQQAAAGLDEAMAAARNDAQAWERLEADRTAARARHQEVQRFLDAHSEDRQAAALTLVAAADELRAVEDAIRHGTVPWARLSTRVGDAGALCDRARQLAQADIDLAARLRREIAEAEAELASARTFHRHGVVVQTASADSLLADARRCWNAGEYERALKQAAAAGRDLRRAREHAEDQVRAIVAAIEAEQRAKRRREEDERRRREAARAVTFSIGSSSMSSSSRGWSGSSSGRSSGSSFSSFSSKPKSSGSSFSSW